MKPRRIKVRAFVEGVEVPVVATQISIQGNAAATAAVQIVPSDGALDILPRSLIHIFFEDFTDGPGDVISVGGAGIVATSLGLDPAEIEKHRYKLLFVGEVVGFTYQKTPEGRQVVLQCLDLSNYWDSCFYYKRGWSYQAEFAGASFKTLNDWLLNTGELINEKLNTPPIGYKNITGILGGVIHLLQAVGGIYGKTGSVSIKGTNVFFSLAELRLQLSRIMAIPDDSTPTKLLSKRGFGSIWNKNIKGLGRQFNFRRAILALMQYIFYEVYPNPVCMKTLADSSALEDPGTMRLADHYLWKFAIEGVRGHINSLVDYRADLVGADDLTNMDRAVKMVEMVEGLKYIEERLAAIAEAFKEPPPSGTDVPVKSSGIKKARARVVEGAKRVKEARNACRKGKNGKGKYLSELPNHRKSNGKLGWKNKQIRNKLDKAEKKLRAVLDLTLHGKMGDTLEIPSRINNQIFRPDVWFVAPPRCNIIFPDQYMSVSYSRNFLNEVTRLLLRTGSSFAGYEMMFDNFFYAPHAQGIKKGGDVAYGTAKEVGIGYMVANRDIMEHELYTGIVPNFQKARGLKIYGIRSGKVVAGDKSAKVDYAQRLANFMFFKLRYVGRVTNIRMIFNPYLVCGFPALVIDRHVTMAKAKEITTTLDKENGDLSAISGMTGTHILGMIISMTHSISQTSATTGVQLGYSRTHREHVDPLGADQITTKVIKGGKKKDYYVCSTTDYAPQVGKDHGLFGGVVTSSSAVPGDTDNHPLWNSPSGRKKGSVFTVVQGNTAKPAKEHGPEVVSLAGSRDASVTFSVYHVEEESVKTEKRVIDMPFEDIVRPAWYGDIWQNRVVGGAVYQPILGTGAVTDPIVIRDQDKTYSLADSDTLTELSEASAETSEDETSRIVISDLEDDATIENAIDFLIYTYSQIVLNGYDIDSFIKAYSWRPVASMYDMFGSDDLEFNQEGEVISGVEGFHSKAFGQYENLFAFVNDNIHDILGISRGETARYIVDGKEYSSWEDVPISSRLDIRKPRQDAVLAYVAELASKGILG